MKSLLPLATRATLLSVAALFLLACSGNVRYVDPKEQGKVQGTGIESQDILAAAEQASRSIVKLPRIANAPTPPVLLLTPVQNKTASPVDTTLYTNVLRDTLMAKAGHKFRFLDRSQASVNELEQELIDAGRATASGGASTARRSPSTYDYILTAELQGIAMQSSQGQSDFFRIAFKLVDRRTDILEWTDAYQIKKEGKDSAVYR